MQKRKRPHDTRDNCDSQPSSKRPDLERVLIPPFTIKDPDRPEAIYYSKPWGRRGNVSVNGVADRLERLASLAAENPKDKRLLQQDFFRLIVSAVKRLNWLARKNPEQWRWLAGRSPTWPVLLSDHPKDWKKATERIRELGVGGDVSPRHYRGARWNGDNDPFMRVASQLMEHVQSAGWLVTEVASPTGWRKDSARLKYEGATAKDWWVVAKHAFLEAYPHPEQIAELTHVATQQLNEDTRRTPGRIKQRILDILESRVHTILGRQHVTKTRRPR